MIVWRDCFDDVEKIELVRNSFKLTSFYEQNPLNESDFKENPQYWFFTTDFTCTNESEEITRKIDINLFSHPYRWIIFVENNEVLRHIRALTDSDVLIAQIINDGFNLKKFYKIEEESSEIYCESYGSWSMQSGIKDERIMKVISQKRENLHGKLITSSYVALNKSSRNHLTDFADKNVDSILKYNYIIINSILDKLNVTKKELFQGTWGYYNVKTKKWSGMVGDIVHKGADIGGKIKRKKGTALFMVAERFPFIDYTTLNTPTRGKFIFRAPQLSAVSNIYTLPFRSSVWFSCLILVLISTILLHLTSQTDNSAVNSEKVNHHKRFTDSMLSTIAAICQMDPSLTSSVTSSRIIMFFIFLAFSFLYAAYTANIVSLLQSPSKNIRTMEDLYNSKIELGIEDTPYNRYYFAAAEGVFEKKVYKKLNPPGEKDHYSKIHEGVARIRKGLYAMIAEETGIYNIMEETFYEHEKCELVNIEFLKFSDPFLAIKKRSPYKEIIKVK
ncbi:CLUMA_CG012625, isoform A [Clunio marinus]|uniref:CLUMA_CG012625, isoform A n=1 Tax=Clunio marinus TaxID=568069 RepID=A0A1J1ILT6_9DIPT|nr:CLUMA_CG012625, isoform A [Clunio marinus]